VARMPGAEWVGPYHDNGVMARYDIVCLHTIVGSAPAHAAHFSTRGDGHIYQSRDTEFQSAANYNGNPRIIAIENADRDLSFSSWDINDGHAVPGFTDQQIESLAQICAWAYSTHGIPLEACSDSRPSSKGIAFHRQGIDGNWAGFAFSGRISGGEIWTRSFGKVCPGDRRISQVSRIISRAREIAGLEVDDMRNLILANAKDGSGIWVGNGLTRRHVEDVDELKGLQYWIAKKGGDPTIVENWADLRVLGSAG